MFKVITFEEGIKAFIPRNLVELKRFEENIDIWPLWPWMTFDRVNGH